MKRRARSRLSSGGGPCRTSGRYAAARSQSAVVRLGGQLRQIAYLKASNPAEDAHLGCGGTLTGHAGNSSAISARRQHDRDGRASRKQRRQGHQRQPERQVGLQLRRGVRLHAPRQHGDPAGLHQGVESRRRRQLRVERRAEPRRQHAGGGRLLRVEQRDRDQRQPGRSLDSGGRRRVHLHAHRQHVVAAGLHQGVEHGQRRGRRQLRRRRSVRLLDRAERRRQHAGRGRDRRGQQRHRRQRRPGGQFGESVRRGVRLHADRHARGRSRRTSSRR